MRQSLVASANSGEARTVRRANVIADALRARCSGQPRGSRLGDESELARHYRTGRRTMRTAVRELERRGILSSRKGRYGGLFVNSAPLDRTAQALCDYITLTDVPISEVAETAMALYRIAAFKVAVQRGPDRENQLRLAHELWAAGMQRHRDVDDWCALRHAFVRIADSPVLTVLQSAFQSAYRDALAAELRLGTLAEIRSYPLWELEGELLRTVRDGDSGSVAAAVRAVTDLESRYLGISLSEGLLSTTLRPETLFQSQTMQRSIGGKLAHQTLRAMHAFIHMEAFAPATRLGTLASLAEHFGIGIDVMREAAALAVEQNLIEVRPGRSGGIFVSDRQSQTLAAIARAIENVASIEEIDDVLAGLAIASREHAISSIAEQLLRSCQLIE